MQVEENSHPPALSPLEDAVDGGQRDVGVGRWQRLPCERVTDFAKLLVCKDVPPSERHPHRVYSMINHPVEVTLANPAAIWVQVPAELRLGEGCVASHLLAERVLHEHRPARFGHEPGAKIHANDAFDGLNHEEVCAAAVGDKHAVVPPPDVMAACRRLQERGPRRVHPACRHDCEGHGPRTWVSIGERAPVKGPRGRPPGGDNAVGADGDESCITAPAQNLPGATHCEEHLKGASMRPVHAPISEQRPGSLAIAPGGDAAVAAGSGVPERHLPSHRVAWLSRPHKGPLP
mmetsp:Transcript_3512/g.10909  ORF Transcript_3512/g.10909 Transcript_3512/m.10909 type:complete len:290 (+) Transcript_3512:1813-2682(+)|eukprot:scaffold53304_cov27-Tisochrysis_lutea.AAC.1